MKKSVTLEGDSFDPAGTLTGGSRPQSSGILSKLAEINDISQQLSQHKEQLLKLDGKLATVSKVSECVLYVIMLMDIPNTCKRPGIQ